MNTQDVLSNLMNYFAAPGSNAGHTFTMRDFNTHVMMNAYSPEDRDCLHLALASLAESGVVHATSPTEYLLTPKGLAEVRALRQARLCA
jgi:hypothetical protein